MTGLWTIIKKEFARFFRDKKLIMTMVFPGILIFFIYTLMGTFMYDFIDDAIGGEVTDTYVIACTYHSEQLESIVSSNGAPMGVNITFVTEKNVETAKENVTEGKYTAFLVLPNNFDELVKKDRFPVPQVEIYYNSTNVMSGSAYNLLITSLKDYEENLVNRFDVNSGGGYDLGASDDFVSDMMGTILSMVVPFLIIVFVIAGATSVTPESIAGEKERGTIATILVTPVNRTYVALGKVLSLSAFTMLGALSSFIGTMFSLPTLMGGSMEGMEIKVDLFSIVSVGDLGLMLLAIVSFVPIVVGLLSILSALAKSVKEATGWTSGVMVVSMIISMTSMFGLSGLWLAFVPVLNVATCISTILAGTYELSFILISVGMNVVYVGLICFILAKLFDSEKIML